MSVRLQQSRWNRDQRSTAVTLGLAATILAIVGLAAACQSTGGPVTLKTSDFAQQVVDANPPGTTFILEPGVHSGLHIVPKDGMSFVGSPNGTVTLDGLGSTAPAFRSDDTISDITLQSMEFTNYAPGFYSAVVDASSEDYQEGMGAPATDWAPSTNWALTDLVFYDNPGGPQSAAIEVGSGSTVDGANVMDHPGVGIYGNGRHITIENSQITNTEAPGVLYHSGGIKLVTVHDTVITNNTVTDNSGPGIWIDINGDNVAITDNTVTDNGLAGIFYEVSRNGTISGNTVTGNGFEEVRPDWLFSGGIVLMSSHDSVVLSNTLVANDAGVTVIDQRTLRAHERHLAPTFGELFEPDASPAPWRAENNQILNNTTDSSGKTGASATGCESVDSTIYETTTFTGNTYSGENSFWWRYGSTTDEYAAQQTLVQWQNDHGHDQVPSPGHVDAPALASGARGHELC